MKKVLFAVVCVVLISSMAIAQDFPRAEIFGGYSLGRVGGDASELYDAWDSDFAEMTEELEGASYSSSQWFKKGFMASAAFNVNEYFGIEAMFNFNAGTMAEFSYSGEYLEGNIDESGKQNGKLFAFMAGPKFAYRGSEAVTPFAHFLVGMNRLSMDFEASCTMDGEDCTDEMVEIAQEETSFFIDESDAGFAFAVGGGLDVNVNESFAIRVIQVDFINSFHGEGDDDFTLKNLNLAFGAVIRIGN